MPAIGFFPIIPIAIVLVLLGIFLFAGYVKVRPMKLRRFPAFRRNLESSSDERDSKSRSLRKLTVCTSVKSLSISTRPISSQRRTSSTLRWTLSLRSLSTSRRPVSSERCVTTSTRRPTGFGSRWKSRCRATYAKSSVR